MKERDIKTVMKSKMWTKTEGVGEKDRKRRVGKEHLQRHRTGKGGREGGDEENTNIK